MSPVRRSTCILTALVLLKLVILTGCHLPSTEEPALAKPAAPESSRILATPVPIRPTGQFFGDTRQYPDGIRVRVIELTTAVLGWFPKTSDENARAGDPYTVISIRLDNHSRAAFEAVFTGRALHGPGLEEAHTVHLDGQTATRTVPPGQFATYEFGFLLPDEHKDDIVFEVGVDLLEHEKAYFVGSVRTS